ncbi:MAG: glycosyltransferase family 2 protein, partial [Cyanobacteria bacterium J06649_4]
MSQPVEQPAEKRHTPPKARSVYIIIPVHNRKETTLTCLSRLREFGCIGEFDCINQNETAASADKAPQTEQYQVVVVDDGSTDGTAEAIQENYSDVTVLQGDGDLWWTGAMVMGMQHACDRGAEFVVWLNDDCLIEADTLPTMVSFARSHPQTIVGPSCFYLKEGEWMPKNSGSTGRKRYAGIPGKATYVDTLSGWCVLIPGDVIATIGLPNMQRFPHYEADTVYLLQATKAGFKACVLGDAKAKIVGELGRKHPRRDFRNYFGPNLGAAQTLNDLFFSKKSPYRLHSQYFYHVARHGYLLGTPLFLIKAVTWLAEWVKRQFLS